MNAQKPREPLSVYMIAMMGAAMLIGFGVNKLPPNPGDPGVFVSVAFMAAFVLARLLP